jgi:hypothetical protein
MSYIDAMITKAIVVDAREQNKIAIAIDMNNGILNNLVKVCNSQKQHITDRFDEREGRTVTSSVVVITANEIVGPRSYPLEISWKRAQVGE